VTVKPNRLFLVEPSSSSLGTLKTLLFTQVSTINCQHHEFNCQDSKLQDLFVSASVLWSASRGSLAVYSGGINVQCVWEYIYMATPKEHIEKMRKHKFCIGEKENPLTEDLHHAVKQLSAELYTKDVHFFMELIQNAEDNDYAPDVEPSLEFVITTENVAGVNAGATLLVFNNEKGFQRQNIDSICSVGRSTKKNKRKDVGKWAITLAFPLGERFTRGNWLV
jgi:hypothetical protein